MGWMAKSCQIPSQNEIPQNYIDASREYFQFYIVHYIVQNSHIFTKYLQCQVMRKVQKVNWTDHYTLATSLVPSKTMQVNYYFVGNGSVECTIF